MFCKTLSKNNLGKKEFIWLTSYIQSIIEGSQRRNSRLEAEIETEAETKTYRLALLTNVQLVFSYKPGPPACGWHHPQQSGLSHINQESRKYPVAMPKANLMGTLLLGESRLC